MSVPNLNIRWQKRKEAVLSVQWWRRAASFAGWRASMAPFISVFPPNTLRASVLTPIAPWPPCACAFLLLVPFPLFSSLQCFPSTSFFTCWTNVYKCSLVLSYVSHLRVCMHISILRCALLPACTRRRRVVRGDVAARTADAWGIHHRESLDLRFGAVCATHVSDPLFYIYTRLLILEMMKTHSTSPFIWPLAHILLVCCLLFLSFGMHDQFQNLNCKIRFTFHYWILHFF